MIGTDGEFLSHVSEVVFDLGMDRLRLTNLDVASRRMTVALIPGPFQPPLYAEGEPPDTSRQGRRTYDWQPAVHAPAWMTMAWLLEDIAAFSGQMADDHIAVTGLEAPTSQICDLLVRDGDSHYRVRIALADREQLLDNPGMFLHEVFAEGRYRNYLRTPSGADTAIVDLRDVL
ncbi:hypothetical protein [Streptomyces poonensis]|uniref:Uncharacterized protein n=1 Tax=Streptomyces poonensis TaxID=68255 RepID=A0A918Q2W6_9ACTN|nr:hypothetical protein [Streptomyces poonensis]GGZ30467.1 hypothetical protein GCM10010365_58780 [Streptomyces poonensis]